MKIGIVGSKESGKSTVGRYLEQHHNFKRIPMAAPIKTMLSSIGLSDEELNGQFKEVKSGLLCNKTPRLAMQTLGTEWGRKIIGEDIWLNIWQNQSSPFPNVIADDVRFQNEVDRIKELSGIIIKVRRPEVEGKSDHESEIYAGVLKADITIWNNGTIVDLYNEIESKIVPELINRKAANHE